MCFGPEMAGMMSVAKTVIPMALQIGEFLSAEDEGDDAYEQQLAAIEYQNARQEELDREAQETIEQGLQAFEPEVRADTQAEAIAAEQDWLNSVIDPVSEAQAIAEEETPAGKVSERFVTDKARATEQELEAASQMAKQLGAIRGASQSITNEQVGLGDLMQHGGMLANFRSGNDAVGNFGVQIAGIQSPNTGGAAMGALGDALSQDWPFSASSAAPAGYQSWIQPYGPFTGQTDPWSGLTLT